MKRTKIALAVGMVLLLTLACATFGGGDQQNNNAANQEQNQEQNNNAQNTEDNSSGGSAGDNQANSDTEAEDKDDQPPDSGAELEGALWETEFGKLLSSGDLAIEGVEANSDYETVGTILTVQFTNLSSDEILVTLPCGLVFVPTTTEEQELMMIQPMEVSLGAGESAEFSPYVVCIEMNAPAPERSSGYTLGYLASEDMLTFAECICGEQLSSELGSMDSVGVQFAAWSISTGGDILSLIEEESGSFEQYLEGLEGDQLVEQITQMMEMFGGEWLDRCGITLEEQ